MDREIMFCPGCNSRVDPDLRLWEPFCSKECSAGRPDKEKLDSLHPYRDAGKS